MGDLLGERKDHLAGVGILLEFVIHPQLDTQKLRVGDLLCGNNPGAHRTSAIETFLAYPVVAEGRTFRSIGPQREIARRKIVGDGVAGNVVQRSFHRDVFRGATDDRGQFRLPIELLGAPRQRNAGVALHDRARSLDEVPRREPHLVRVRLRREIENAGHLAHVIGIVGARAENSRRIKNWREQPGLCKGSAWRSSLRHRCHSVLNERLGLRPIVQHAKHGGMGRFAGEFRQIENRIFEYGAGAGATRRFVGHEFVVCAVPLSIHHLIPRTLFCAKSRVHFVNARKLLMTSSVPRSS